MWAAACGGGGDDVGRAATREEVEYVLGGFDIYAGYGACAGERLLTENKRVTV